MKKTLFPILILASVSLSAQQKFTRFFQFSLTPGLSSNGIRPGGFKNYISLNLTSGYSSANSLLEIGIVSNLNETETRGLQFAGIANFTGANVFAGFQQKELEKRLREGFEANLSGAQFSGLTNFVLNNIFGAQISGGINTARGAMQGFQLAGIGNSIHKYSFGVQFAGLYNVSAESMDGIQMSSFANFTKGELYGLQLSLINYAGIIEGKNSYEKKSPTGIQAGLLNFAKSMNGYQLGLVNIGKRMQGTQIGLVNIFKNGKTLGTRDGTSIGLINIGSSGYLALYANEMFLKNVEAATGTVKNRRINTDRRERQIQNGLIYASGSLNSDHKKLWALGYSIKKLFFNRSATPGHSHFNFISAGCDFLQLNQVGKFQSNLNLLTRTNLAVGSKIHPKNKICFVFVSVAWNFYKSTTGDILSPFEPESKKILVGSSGRGPRSAFYFNRLIAQAPFG
jgi:hypothetical protein